MEPLDPGPCQYYQIKWFWDQMDEECKEFHYGGCLGSRNRFDSKQQCMKQCIYKMHNPVAVPDLCLLDADPGHCDDDRRGQWWYHFDAATGECDKFFYYGCGGNDNRFYSLYQCRKVCGERLSPQIGITFNMSRAKVFMDQSESERLSEWRCSHEINLSACDRCDLRRSFCKSHSKYNYTCECLNGFEKNAHGECIDIDECRTHTANCDRNAWCKNTIGSYECECKAAYRGNGKHCTFVGLGRSTIDCTECSPDATCLSGICMCKEGFVGDGFNCSDVNECYREPHVCDKNAECRNVEGSFICECLPGFAGNGYNCTTETSTLLAIELACLDKFDRSYQEQCGAENWREHYYLDHLTKRCSLFWYDGCAGTSRNIFSDLSTCETMCEMTNALTRAEICWDKFDTNYKNQCLHGDWQQRYYFDHASMTCRLFWYDGCSSKSRNIFEDLLTCQWLCEEQPIYKSRSCLETFDEHYKDECNGGRWKKQFYFDKQNKKCVAFWYDGCTGESQNIFQDEITCIQLCEQPQNKDRTFGYNRGDLCNNLEPNMTNICETANPCENNGTCLFDRITKTHYCKCAPGYTNANCTERIEFDPCSSNPCKNGATCSAKAGQSKTTFECFCAIGYGGEFCEAKPCESNPCLNNGTCRTTRGFSTFFCDCPPKFGGKLCDIAVGETKPPKYGKNVQLLSSGKVEWIEQLKKVKAKEREMKMMKKERQNDRPIKGF
ncbi:unnamed protein product [Anisakis simplex]|uniref:Kunitz/Bovine pancreatic trypsin inhibitor domain protein n=1 Tax=Anisakis simplex TaxID=6269 RepID=A0A158PPP7_ANISI|nr:unnamed protein product [Anisakis simplex]